MLIHVIAFYILFLCALCIYIYHYSILKKYSTIVKKNLSDFLIVETIQQLAEGKRINVCYYKNDRKSIFITMMKSRYNPITSEVHLDINVIESNNLSLINVACHEFAHHLYSESHKSLKNLFKGYISLISIIRICIIPTFIIGLPLVLITDYKMNNLLMYVIYVSFILIMIQFSISLTKLKEEYIVGKKSIEVYTSLGYCFNNEEEKFYKKLNTTAFVSHIFSLVLFLDLFIMIFNGYLYFS